MKLPSFEDAAGVLSAIVLCCWQTCSPNDSYSLAFPRASTAPHAHSLTSATYTLPTSHTTLRITPSAVTITLFLIPSVSNAPDSHPCHFLLRTLCHGLTDDLESAYVPGVLSLRCQGGTMCSGTTLSRAVLVCHRHIRLCVYNTECAIW